MCTLSGETKLPLYVLANISSECEMTCKKCDDSGSCNYVMISSDSVMGKSRGWEICGVSLEYIMDLGN